MFNIDDLSQEELKQLIHEKAVNFSYRIDKMAISGYGSNKDRVQLKCIKNERLRKAICYVKTAKFRIYYGTLGKQCYKVYIRKDLLRAICISLNLNFEEII